MWVWSLGWEDLEKGMATHLKENSRTSLVIQCIRICCQWSGHVFDLWSGGFLLLWSHRACVSQLPSLCSTAGEPQLLSLCAATAKAHVPRAWKPTPVLLPGKFHELRGSSQPTVHGVAKSQTQLSDFTLYDHMQFDYEVRNKKAWIPIPVLLLTSYEVRTIAETESWFSIGVRPCFHINGIPHFQLDIWSPELDSLGPFSARCGCVWSCHQKGCMISRN